MINAKIQAELTGNAGLLIEFSDPYGNYKDQPNFFVVVRDQTDLLQRLYFKNRVYICDTLFSFLNQRAHALPEYKVTISELKKAIGMGKNYVYPALCSLIASKSESITRIAPGEKSRFNDHYQTVIVPILIECKNVHTGKAKVHYC